MRRSVCTLLAGCAAAVGAAPAADAAEIRSRHLWATVNVCDTLPHPDTIGIRASMPGSRYRGERMFMRFRVQYLNRRDQRWRFVRKGGDSGFKPVGTADVKARQAGRLFTFPPPAGATFELRGHVTFQWRRDGKVRRSAVRLTTAGRRSTAGSDPPGYSSDTCVIG